ncbi:MAG: RagB/SusD family nutrient uptake outer membrane protein [Paludibacteraceae bacterium]|jgi:hypothetical protein|nr:RagB/SusD family nutrient uptake outer membrane protein [Paludibacteraceae bacterium]HOF97960.1 RagB/SusD family nutrient uptake outer membrane protein [Paludibacteraceae bacterium]HOR38716.1 RagB/SusD family nutrient uptake outer membrane protein [Paludibacteraceae bacterium]
MKKSQFNILQTFALLIISIIMSSCEDFLSSIRNENSQSIESLLYNINDIDVCINGAYGAFCSNSYYNNVVLTQTLGSDEITNTKNPSILPDFLSISAYNYHFSYQCNTDNYQAGSVLMWGSFVTNNSNVVIKSIENKLPNLRNFNDTLNAERLLGEAYLLRACVEYYNNLYVGRQYHPSTLQLPASLYRKRAILGFEDIPEPRKTVEQVHQYIIEDLQNARKLLPQYYEKTIHPVAYQYRCKRDVAIAMLAKAYFQQNQFDSALVYINQLLGNQTGASNKYPLQTTNNYNQLFRIVDKTNYQANSKSEIIMGFHGNSAFRPTSTQEWSMFHWSAFQNLQNSDLTNLRFRIVMDSALIKSFLKGDTLNDVRFKNMIYITKNIGKESPAGQWTSLKHAYPTSNVVWLRAAEFHLMRAEIYLHKDNLSSSINELNIVRKRAGLDNYTFAGKTQLFQAIIDERFREMHFEGIRRSDNIRLASLSDSNAASYLPMPYKLGNIPLGNRALLITDSILHWNDERLYCLIPENEYIYNPALKR